MATQFPPPSVGPPGAEPDWAAPERPVVIEDDPTARWKPWTGFGAPILALAASLVAGFLVSAIAAATGASLTDPPASVNLILTYVGDACFVAAALFCAQRVAFPRARDFGLRRPAIKIGLAVALVIGAYVAFLIIAKLWTDALNIHQNDDKLPRTLGAQDSHVALVLVAVLTCVVAPICEEFLFRGYMFRALRNWHGPWPAALIVGLIFGAFHIEGSPVGFLVPLAIFGVMLCLVYELTDSLYPCIALHAVNNSIAFAAIEHARGGVYLLLPVAALTAIWLLLRFVVEAWPTAGRAEPAR
jgi:uncharacterized protein